MSLWVRFDHGGAIGFGVLEQGNISVHSGDLFSGSEATGQVIGRDEVCLLTPCTPGKFIGLWNNDQINGAKQGWGVPAHPLYFLKPITAVQPPETVIPVPPGYAGRVLYEGELGIVIGRRCAMADEQAASEAIFGFTCVNDVTALDVLHEDPSFPQWARAKGFDGFGPFGPAIATGLDAENLTVRTLVNGRERQNFSCAGMHFSAARIVSALSRDMTLEPGDLIACGTSAGALPMRPGTVVEVHIEGVGGLRNTYGVAPDRAV